MQLSSKNRIGKAYIRALSITQAYTLLYDLILHIFSIPVWKICCCLQYQIVAKEKEVLEWQRKYEDSRQELEEMK